MQNSHKANKSFYTKIQNEARFLFDKYEKHYLDFVVLCYAAGFYRYKSFPKELTQDQINDLYHVAFLKRKGMVAAQVKLHNFSFYDQSQTLQEKRTQLFLTFGSLKNDPDAVAFPRHGMGKLLVGSFFPDFMIFGINENPIMIEVDGGIHEVKALKDEVIEVILNSVLGVQCLRIRNEQCGRIDNFIKAFLKESSDQNKKVSKEEILKQISIVKLLTISHYLSLNEISKNTGLPISKLSIELQKNGHHKNRLRFPDKACERLKNLLSM